MFLKRIELTGFKSFADKTELEFVNGITAVVGPNGSGKSNISDGIRWVLGEQSAKSLRGGKMEDVIFAGSVSRKPVNYCEVSLTLDNDDHALPLDFSEVTVTRRINRSGDSDYYINKQVCRLRDITELFMDTGIGKEAYSIIGQGRIEEILSTRSEDRRAIFEEASGIVKYKTRKREAQKKLDETEQNLLRIHDLISELEDQIEPLREQSEKAQKFKQLREELKSSEISVYVFQIEQIHRSWQEAGDKLKQLQEEQLQLSTVVSRHDAHLEKHRMETRRLEEELEQLHAALLKFSEEYEKCEGQGEVLKERQKNLEQNRRQLEQTIAAQEKRRNEREQEKLGMEQKFEAVSQKLGELKETLLAEEERLLGVHGGTAADKEEGLKAELLDALNRIAHCKNEIRYHEQQIEAAERRMMRLDDDQKQMAEEAELLTAGLKSKEEQIAAAARQIDEIKEQYVAIAQSIKGEEKLLEEAVLTTRKWEQKIEALASRRDTILEMHNDFEGFLQGVKEVLKTRGKSGGLGGVQGAVAELVKVSAQYETAIETALGGALQHIVMEDEASAREAIAYLKRRQLGRATFLPLDVIQGRFIADAELKAASALPGFVGTAVDLVSYDRKYANIFHSLLGNVLIAEQMEQANRIAAACRYRYRVVTLEGDVVNAGGSMTGGSQQRKNANLLGRQRQLEQMDEEIKQSKSHLEEIKGKANKLKQAIASLTSELETLRQKGEQSRLDEQQLRAEYTQLQNEQQRLSSQLELFAQEGQSHGDEQQQNRRKIEQLAADLQQHQETESALQQAIREAEAARKIQESAREQIQAQLTDLKVKVAEASQEKQAVAQQIARLDQDLAAISEEMAGSRELLSQMDRDEQQNQLEAVQQLENLNHFQLKKQECSETIEFKRAERAQAIRKLEEEENETKEQRVQLKQIEEGMHQTEVRVNRLDVELDNLLNKLSEEYEMSYELAKERYPVPEDIMGTQSLVRDLKRQIAQLGEVNLGAIEEFQRVSERFAFLSEQQDDLIEAKSTLYQVIREIETEMSNRFEETFEAIRSQFVIVFSKLFGGGRADLVLSEPGNLLDTGIEIVAQPPGKKLQNLSLLSGGERALTAIALLFAILRIKPVPFCVLDEVEAALDDANVTRFAEYLREFSNETQFIVVTHRKGTMEEADVLYGVTMEEDGISKLVSVRLEGEDEPVSA